MQEMLLPGKGENKMHGMNEDFLIELRKLLDRYGVKNLGIVGEAPITIIFSDDEHCKIHYKNGIGVMTLQNIDKTY